LRIYIPLFIIYSNDRSDVIKIFFKKATILIKKKNVSRYSRKWYLYIITHLRRLNKYYGFTVIDFVGSQMFFCIRTHRRKSLYAIIDWSFISWIHRLRKQQKIIRCYWRFFCFKKSFSYSNKFGFSILLINIFDRCHVMDLTMMDLLLSTRINQISPFNDDLLRSSITKYSS